MNANLLTLLPFVLTIATSAAAAVAYFRASYAKATIDALKENNSALESRSTILERALDGSNLKAQALQDENTLLRTLVPAEETLGTILNYLIDLVDQHKIIIALLERPPTTRTRSSDVY